VSQFIIRAATEQGLWTLGRESSEVEFEDRRVSFVATGSEQWALVESKELWRRPPDGEWECDFGPGGPVLRCLLPYEGGVLIGAEEARLFRYQGSALERVMSFDFTEGRDDWFTPWGGPPDLRSMSRSDNGALFANVHVGGILRSLDDGAVWEPTIDMYCDVHEVQVAHGEPDRVLAATAKGVAESTDGGDSWEFVSEGFRSPYCRAVAACTGAVLATASDGPHGTRAAIYRRPPGSDTFAACSLGLPDWFEGNIDTACLRASGSEAVFGTADGSVYASRDSGLSWRLVTDELPPVLGISLDAA
jgi:hypothetical protein